jgi:serine/threonine protein kinase
MRSSAAIPAPIIGQLAVTLTPGARLGPYRILASIGSGGMGEVYRARDTSLNRDVALKILPDVFASDPDRLARFTREAQTLAALNHSHIAQIYGLIEAPPTGSADWPDPADTPAGLVPPRPLTVEPGGDAVRALVMELVEGEDLSERIARGALPVEDALRIARQIAEALEAAHEQRVIHRDLKPANVKLREDGGVKVLDFGLAKALDAAPVPIDGLSRSPTFTSPALVTGVGVLLGRAAYMSPEQAKGRAADTRSDIWAFGSVLFEMLTGRVLFTGDTVTEVLASVMKDAPPLEALPPATPPGVRRLLRRCLERDPKQRLRDIGEARIALEAALAGTPDDPPESAAAVTTRAPTKPRSVWFAWMVAASALGITAAAVFSWAPWREDAPAAAVRLSTELGADVSLVTEFGAAAVLSPDGTTLVFAAQPAAGEPSQLYVRRLQSLQASALFDRAGNSRRLHGQPAVWLDLQFAPDGNRMAATRATGTSFDIWVLDATKDILSRLTFGAETKVDPAFTPDGTRIAHIGGQQTGDIYWQRADGSDTPQRLTTRRSGKAVLSFHPSGKWLAFGEYDAQSNRVIDIMVTPLEGGDTEGWKPGEPTPFAATPAAERDPAFSPDGRWIAYSSDETGRPEIYVRPFPGPGGKWQVSTGGGRFPAWSRARPELLYAVPTPGGSDIMSAAYAVKGDAFVAERPRPHLTGRIARGPWALHPDGTSIAAIAATAASEQTFVKQDKVGRLPQFLR